MRHFGICLAYGPTVDLRKEGLGRLLVAFLKAAVTKEDVRFVIACPEWSREGLLALCESEGIPASAFDLVSTDGLPVALRIALAWRARKQHAQKQSRLSRLLAWLQSRAEDNRACLERRLVATRSVVAWLAFVLAAAAVGVVLLPLLGVLLLCRAVYRVLWRWARVIGRSLRLRSAAERLLTLFVRIGEESLIVRLYRMMEDAEGERLLKKINSLRHVQAWYCPTAFWPVFNRITAPRLMCVPDVLPAEFPIGFAGLEPELAKSFEILERSIRGGRHFVTYSSRMKWDTLVERYSVRPAAVDVVPHACWDLGEWITLRGFPDNERVTTDYCQRLLGEALRRAGTNDYAKSIASGSSRFLVYASQFRPNKNVLTLLRAYEYLLRKRFFAHKLILTGDPVRFPTVGAFIRDRSLQNDVLCLHGLSAPELAACFRLAELAVNPSFSEGGCPFTLTEALSVNTPVVMARIPVTEEIVTEPALRNMMLFDPYDWRDVAARIEWALDHREPLLVAQRALYAKLQQRTWRNVVDDCVVVLEHLVDNPESAAGRR
jgi:glycosyltransferase involved in cell wall biosynthesis